MAGILNARGNQLRWLRVCAIVVAVCVANWSWFDASAAPSQTQIYWGAVIHGERYGFGPVPRDMRGVTAFESHAGKGVSIISIGGRWVVGGVFQEFDTAGFENIRRHGSIPLFTWMSAGDTWADFTNAIVASGRYDAYIRRWARAARAWGHPFFLRFDHEMDGSWYPWGEGRSTPNGPIANGNTPGSFVRMWRHVHGIFVQEGATNATWVWNVNQESTTGRYPPLSQIYPGDSYVDWTGIDGYNRYPTAWQRFDQIWTGIDSPLSDPMANIYQLVLNVAPTKPMMIGEVASTEDANNPNRKPAWLRDAYLTQTVRNFPAIKAIIYYNRDDAGPALRIESSAASQTAFANAIALSTYPTNSFSQLAAGKIGVSPERMAYLTPVADTYILSELPNSTRGTATSLGVVSHSTRTHIAFLRFDLRSLAGRTVSQAVLQISTAGVSTAGSPGTFNVRYVSNNNWSENMTWNNRGGATASTVLGSFAAPAQINTTYIAKLPVTFIQARTGGLLSLQMDTSIGDELLFASREAADPKLRPQLILAYH